MSEEAPLSKDMEQPDIVIELTEDDRPTIEESGTAMSNDMQTHSIVGENDPMTVDRLGGEGSVDEEDVDDDSQKGANEGFTDSVDVDVLTHNGSMLYPDYFDNFGNVRSLQSLECDSWCIQTQKKTNQGRTWQGKILEKEPRAMVCLT